MTDQDITELLPETLKERLRTEELGRPYTDVKGGAEVNERGNEAQFVLSNVDPDLISEVSFGSIATVLDLERELWFGGRVVGIEQHWPYETDKQSELMDYSRESLYDTYSQFGANVYAGKQVVTLDLLSSFSAREAIKNEEISPNPVTNVPSPASVMLLPKQNPDAEPALSDILDIPKQGLNLAVYSSDQEYYRDPDGNPLLYNLNLSDMENQHVFVAGTTGVGKTVLLKHYIKQALLEDYSVLAFDIQGDIIQSAIPYDLYREVLGDQATTPSESNEDIQEAIDSHEDIFSENKRIKFLRPIKDGLKLKNRWDRFRDVMNSVENEYDANIEFDHFDINFDNVGTSDQLQMFLPYLSDQAVDLLRRLFREFNRRQPNLNVDHTLEGFNEWCHQVYNGADSNGQYLYPDELDGYNVHSATFNNLTRNIDVLMDEGIFDGASEPSWQMEPDTLYIVYMYHLPDDTRHKYEYHIMSQLYAQRENHLTELYAVIDEAHRVIPRRAYGFEEDFLETVSREFRKIGREGRKYGLNLLISSQKPEDVHKVVYDMTSTKIAFRLSEGDARDMNIDKEYQNIIPSYDTGNAIIRSPENCKVPWVEIKTALPKIPHDDPQEFFDSLEGYQSYFNDRSDVSKMP